MQKKYFKSLKTLLWLLPFLWVKNNKIRFGIIISILFTFFSIFLNIYLPFFFKNIIHYFTISENKEISVQYLLIVYGFVWMLSHIVSQINFVGFIPALERGIRLLTLKTAEHLHALSMKFHVDRKTGSMVNIIDRAHTGLDTLLWTLFLFIIPTTTEMFIISFIFATLYEITYSFVLFFTAVAYLFLCHYGMNTMEKLQTNYNEKKSKSSNIIVDSLLNVETVKYFQNQGHESNRCDAILQEQEVAGLKLQFFSCFLQCAQKIIIGIGLTILTYKSGCAVMLKKIDVGDFILINSYLLQFTAPLSNFGYVIRQIRKGLTDMQDLIDIFATKTEIQDIKNPIILKEKTADVVFSDVSFSYDQDRKILHHISFKILQEKTVAIVGATGSGKSTITRLLFRFYDPTQGTIFFNNHDIKTIAQKSLQKMIGVVSQDTHLFNDTIYYNILYGNLAATKEEVEEAIYYAQLTDFIKNLPERYNTIVGERGLKLSGGEKQRIAIARVLLKNPALYIFDEATSAVDNHTEFLLQKNIQKIAKNKTTLIIAHRLSTITHADEIIVLEQGRIIEQGNHNTLLTHGSVYKKLWNKQETTRI